MKTRLRRLPLALLFGLGMISPLAAQAAAPTVAVAAHEPSRQAVVDEAMKYLHYRYVFSGGNPKTGFSCIGFVWYVFQSLGVNMPGNLNTAIAAYPRIRERNLLPGDIVFFHNTVWNGVSHVAIYIGNGRVIHAENPRRGVNISSIRNDQVEGNYWQQHYLTAERPLARQSWTPPPAPSYPQAVVTVPSLNVRADHSLDATVVTVITRGAVVSVLGSSGAWFQIQMSDGTGGWLVQAGVRVESGTRGAEGHGNGGRTGRRKGKSHRRSKPGTYSVVPGVRIHTGPSLTASVISLTTDGMTVAVLGHTHGFTHIRCSNGLGGWIASQFLIHPRQSGGSAKRRRSKAPSAHPATLSITAHIRTGPSLSARIIQWVRAGTRVAILRSVPLWDYVRVNSKLKGYIYSQFLVRQNK